MANPMAGSVADAPPQTSSVETAPPPALAPSALDPDQEHVEPEVARRLRAQYAEISQLAGGLAHEIRNPLSTLSLNLDLLAEDFRDADNPRDRRAQQRVDRLKREVQRLYDILENFLRFARVQELKLSATDLNT